jgi:hypothetical protein|tara:strand:+ start:82 stop:324 length:243 start_codon:yes stop_codon:yes gene_type:complete
MGVRIPRAKGQIVAVTWLDAVGYIGESAKNAKPSSCETIGRLKRVEDNFIVIATSQYQDGDSGDYTVLPTGMITEVKTVR